MSSNLRRVGARSRSLASSLRPGLTFGPAIPQNPSRVCMDEKWGEELQSSGLPSLGLTWIFSVLVKSSTQRSGASNWNGPLNVSSLK